MARSHVGLLLLVLSGVGCSQAFRQDLLAVLFDGSLRPAAALEESVQAADGFGGEAGMAGAETKTGATGSEHLPYVEKRCDDCHDFEQEVGLVRPARELCFLCHEGFIRGRFVHGPVSVGNCLACHVPHSSRVPALLERGRTEICDKCHREGRLAEEMHTRVIDHEMDCVDCHDPHDADTPNLLR